MTRKRSFRQDYLQFGLTWLISLFLFVFSTISQAQTTPAAVPTPAKQAVAQVVWVKGDVKAIGENKTTRVLQRGGVVYAHDTLVTSAGGSGQIVFTDNTLMSLSPNTQMQVKDYNYTHGAAPKADKYLVDVAKGGFRTISGAIAKSNPNNYQVSTPVATIGVRGTEWAAEITANNINLKIESGSISIQTPTNEATLTAGTDKLYATIDVRVSNPQVAVTATAPEGAFTTEPPPVSDATSTLPKDESNSSTPAASGSSQDQSDGGTSSGGSSSDSGSGSGSSSDSGSGSDSSSDSGTGSSDTGSSTSDGSSTSSTSSSDTGSTTTDSGSTTSSGSTPSATSGSGKPASGFCIQ